MSDSPSTTLGEIGTWGSGGTPKSTEASYYGGDIPWIRSGDLPDGPVLRHPISITKAGLENSSARWVPEGALLIALYGATIGKLGITTYPVTTNQAVAYCVPEEGVTSAEFLFWYLLSARPELVALAQGGAQPNISQAILKSRSLVLPPQTEQHRIVNKLASLFKRSKSAREQLIRIPSLAERYRQAIFDAAFRGELTTQWREQNTMSRWTVDHQQHIRERRQTYITGRRGSRLRDAPPLSTESTTELPNSWMSGCLADIADLRTGYAFKSTWFSSEGPKLLRGANISPGRLIWDDTKRLSSDQVPMFEKEFRLRAGDIVIAMDRPMISGGLKVAMLGDQDEGAFLVQRVASPVCSPLVVPKFLWFLINSGIFIEHIEKHATGSDLPHISSNDILTTPFPLPPLMEQMQIVSIIEKACDSISKQLVEALRANALLERLEQATLTKAFRGELVVGEFSNALSLRKARTRVGHLNSLGA